MNRINTTPFLLLSMRWWLTAPYTALACIISCNEVLAATIDQNFLTGSGFTAIGQIGDIVRPLSLALAIAWAVWGIISEVRAMSVGDGDAWSFGSGVIRGAILPLFIATLILVLT